MGLRKYKRDIARDLLNCMYVGKVNNHFGIPMKNSTNRKFQRTRKGRRILEKFWKIQMGMPLWKRVLYGDLKKQAAAARQRNILERKQQAVLRTMAQG